MKIADGCAADRLGRGRPELRRFVAQHDDRVADLDLRVRDAAVRPGHAESLLRAERLLVELDRLGGLATHEVRRHGVVPGGIGATFFFAAGRGTAFFVVFVFFVDFVLFPDFFAMERSFQQDRSSILTSAEGVR